MSDNFLSFDESTLESTPPSGTSSRKELQPPKAERNPYEETSNCPNDIFDYLAPDSTMFGLFSDPYASMLYHDPRRGNNTGRYWLRQRLEEHSFTENEIELLRFLSKHRIATRNQIHRVVFNLEDRPEKVRDFLRKCRQRGIICSFSWISPLKDGKKKPLIYGLTRIGVEAAEKIFHTKVEDGFTFQPVQFKKSQGPFMTTFFLDLVANELYSDLVRIDRVLEWERRKTIRLHDGTIHTPGAVFDLIKDEDQFLRFWLETVRITDGWVNRTIQRFKQTQLAYEKVDKHNKPARVIVIIDGDSRIPFVGELAATYMPDVQVRYTTDERLVKGISEDTFLSWNREEQRIKISKMSFLSEDHTGMTASEYFASQEVNIEDEDDSFEE